MATKKSAVKKPEVSTYQKASNRLVKFVTDVMNALEIDSNNGRITSATFASTLNKLKQLVEESNYLWNEVSVLEARANELERGEQNKVEEVKRFYEEFIDELEKEYEEKFAEATQTNAQNLNAIYSSFNKTCDEIKGKLDEKNLLKTVQDLRIKLQNAEARVNSLEEQVDVAQGEAYEQYVRAESSRERINKLAREAEKAKDSASRASRRIREFSADERRKLIQKELCKVLGVDDKEGFDRSVGLLKATRRAKKTKTFNARINEAVSNLNNTSAFSSDKTNEDEVKGVLSSSTYNLRKATKIKVVTATTALALVVGGAVGFFFGTKTANNNLINENERGIAKNITVAQAYTNEGKERLQQLYTLNPEDAEASKYGARLAEIEDENAKLAQLNENGGIVGGQTRTISAKAEKAVMPSQRKEAEVEYEQVKAQTEENTQSAMQVVSSIKSYINENYGSGIVDPDAPVEEQANYVYAEDEIKSSVKDVLKNYARGNLNHFAMSYNKDTGDIVMVAQVENRGNVTLVVGEAYVGTGLKLDKETLQKYLSAMEVEAFSKYDSQSGVFYNVNNASHNGVYGYVAKACKVEYDAEGKVSQVQKCTGNQFGENIDVNDLINHVIDVVVNQNDNSRVQG